MKLRAFCELPAGLAAVSLRLHGGAHCRPPISRMGSKRGYAEAILDALGLHGGQGAGAYVWAEADPDVRALLRAYPDAAMLTRIAEIIRGWADEEPRALWERLRAERKARGPVVTAEDAAGWVVAGQWSFRRCNIDSGYNKGVAEGAAGTPTHHGGGALTVVDIAEAVEALAGWVWVAGHGDSSQPPRLAAPYQNPDGNADGSWRAPPRDWLATRCARLASRWPPVAVLPTLPTAADLSALLGTPGDLDGAVVYMDPPYVGTTGYGHDLGRDAVVNLASAYDAAGAVVCISEAEPIAALGWHATEITGGRRGQTRTFSKQQREWLTMNRPPTHTVATQTRMFA